jgi:hypothetical protein
VPDRAYVSNWLPAPSESLYRNDSLIRERRPTRAVRRWMLEISMPVPSPDSAFAPVLTVDVENEPALNSPFTS